MGIYLPLLLILISSRISAQTLVSRYEFWDYYGNLVYDYSGNNRHAEIQSVGSSTYLTDRGLYFQGSFSLRFLSNLHGSFPTVSTDVVFSILFHPVPQARLCLLNLVADTKNIRVCLINNSELLSIKLEGDVAFVQETTAQFKGWKLVTIRFSETSSSTVLMIYINGDDANPALSYILDSFKFVLSSTYWEVGSKTENIEGFLHHIWWHRDVTGTISGLSTLMIQAYPECSTIYTLSPYKACLSSQTDKFTNSEDEPCTNCSNLSCDKDQICIDSCLYKCVASSECRTTSSPLCPSPAPTNCNLIPSTDICYSCNPGWIPSPTIPGRCESSITECIVFDTLGKCTTCNEGYYLTASATPICIQCPDSCISCNLLNSIVTCLRCSAGLYIQPYGALCAENCPPGYAASILDPLRCIVCPPNCLSCNYNSVLEITVCSECNSSFYLMEFTFSINSTNKSNTQCSDSCLTGSYVDTTTVPICKKCMTNCNACISSINCSSCMNRYYLDADGSKCLSCPTACDECSSGTVCTLCTSRFYVNEYNQCSSCGGFCTECENPTKCSSCLTDFLLFTYDGSTTCQADCGALRFARENILTCVSYPADGTVVYCTNTSSSNFTCQNCLVEKLNTPDCKYINCLPNCKKCDDSSGVIKCSVCILGTYLQPDKMSCQSTCPDYYYKNTITPTCLPCYVKRCKSCNPFNETRCEVCGEGFYLHDSKQQCLASCPAGYFGDTSGAWICISCRTGCSVCSNTTDCITCNTGLYKLTDSTGITSCLSSCPAKHYFDANKVCYSCMTGCDICSLNASGIQVCTKCSVGYFYKNNICVELKCDPNCADCFLTTDNLICYRCKSGYFVQINEYQCDTTCPVGYYPNTTNTICTICPSFCEECVEDPSKSPSCTRCTIGYRFETSTGVTLCEIITCPLSCPDCTITGNDIACNTCEVSYFMQPSNPVCEMTCPDRYYADTGNRYCKECSSNCAECDMSGCTSCDMDYYIKPDLSCDTVCPDGYYKDDLIWRCQLCNILYCILCDKLESTVECTLCENKYYIYPDGGCNMICPDGYYGNPDTMTCDKCPFEFCATCGFESNGILKCSKCIPKHYLFLQPGENLCKFICPKGYYPDDTQSVPVCSPCQPLCNKCSSLLDCQECISSYYIQPWGSNITCSNSCPLEYYGSDIIPPTCIPCFPFCLECYEYECKKCRYEFYHLPDDKYDPCKVYCPDPYYPTEILGIKMCMKCMEGCNICYSGEECQECSEYYYLLNGVCIPCDIPNCKNCQVFNNELHCIECVEGQSLIDVIENSCISECPRSYYTYYNKEGGKSCSKCIDNCEVCPGYDECLFCLEGFYYDTLSKKCLTSIIENCLEGKYHDGEFTCSKCAEGYYSIELDAQACVSERPDSYFWDESSQSFKKCMDNCAKCESSNICDECLDGSSLESSCSAYSATILARASQVSVVTSNLSIATQSSAICIGILNLNMSSAISLLNTTQIFKYLTLMQVDLHILLKKAINAQGQDNYIPDTYKENLIGKSVPSNQAHRSKFKSTSFLWNSRKELFMLIMILLAHSLSYLLSKISKGKVKTLSSKIAKMFCWKVYGKYFIVVYFDVANSALLQLIYVIIMQPSQDSTLDIINYILSSIVSVLLILLPSFLLMLTYLNFEKLMNTDYLAVWGSFYEEFNSENRLSCYFYCLFFIRRFLLAVSFHFLYNDPAYHILIIVTSCWIPLLYLLCIRPYKISSINYFQILNEINISMGYSFTGLLFFEGLIDPITTSWIVLGFMYLSYIIHLIQTLSNFIKIFRNWIQARFHSRREARYRVPEDDADKEDPVMLSFGKIK